MGRRVLGRMAPPGPHFTGAVAGQAVGGTVAAAGLLPQFLEGLDQIPAVEAETGPVLGHPQALPGPVEGGVEQAEQGLSRINISGPTGLRRNR